jgi:hypothetical protein
VTPYPTRTFGHHLTHIRRDAPAASRRPGPSQFAGQVWRNRVRFSLQPIKRRRRFLTIGISGFSAMTQKDNEQNSDDEAQRRFMAAVKAGLNTKLQPRKRTTPKGVPAQSKKKPKTKREHFVTSMTCPVCALNGSATWEESERGDLETTIKSISDGFRIDRGNEIYCADCGVKANAGRTLKRSEMKSSGGS